MQWVPVLGALARARARGHGPPVAFAPIFFHWGRGRWRGDGCGVFFPVPRRGARHDKRSREKKDSLVAAALPFFFRTTSRRGGPRARKDGTAPSSVFFTALSRGVVSRRIESPCGLGKDHRPLARRRHRLFLFFLFYSLVVFFPLARRCPRERHRRTKEEEKGTPLPFFFLSFGDIRRPGFLASGRRPGGAPRDGGGGRARRPSLTRRVSPFSAPH